MVSIVFLSRKRFIKLLFERKLRHVMDGSVLHVAVSTDEALELLRPVRYNGSSVSEEVMSIRTAYGCVDLMSGPIHCFLSLVEASIVLVISA